MGLLYPLYLLGALALAIPILLHLRKRPPKDRMVFSSLMFLDPQTPQRKSRSKLENLLLLALRCLALILLALLFSRPFMRDPNALASANAGDVRVVLIDRSASMLRGGLWDAAKVQAGEILEQAEAEDQVAVVAFDSAAQVLVSFEEWKELPAVSRAKLTGENLSQLRVSWEKTQLDTALIEAVGLIEDETRGVGGTQEIVLISDLQEGAIRSGLENFAWPEAIQLRLLAVQPGQTENAAAHLVASLDDGDDNDSDLEAVSMRIRITNSADSESEA